MHFRALVPLWVHSYMGNGFLQLLLELLSGQILQKRCCVQIELSDVFKFIGSFEGDHK